MRKENYKRLGDYIKKVNVRNTENLDIPLMGLSIEKCFIPSIANTIGTNMTRYKIIERNQFAYGPVTSRNGDKITIALFEDYDKALISQAYVPFKIIDTEKLLPKYLMMWFSRPEFDRYARFKSHGSARETFDWDDMCEVMLPVPSPEKQQAIVADYQAVEQKIKTNEALCEKLEETAQTIYRRWFEEFEFPVEDGKPYKSNGGKMVWNEELEKDVPEGWEVKMIKEVSKISAGGDKPKIFSKTKTDNCFIPIYSNGIIEDGLYGYTNEAKVRQKAITVSARGTIGYAVMRLEPFVPIVRLVVVIPDEEFYFRYLFDCIHNFKLNASGSVQRQLTVPNFSVLKLLIPAAETLVEYQALTDNLLQQNLSIKDENQKLRQFQSLLLARMTREEGELVNS